MQVGRCWLLPYFIVLHIRYRGRGGRPVRDTETQNGFDGEKRPKVSASSNKNSGKSWRSGEWNEEDNRRPGGKCKWRGAETLVDEYVYLRFCIALFISVGYKVRIHYIGNISAMLTIF